jgi:hypothetical protein
MKLYYLKNIKLYLFFLISILFITLISCDIFKINNDQIFLLIDNVDNGGNYYAPDNITINGYVYTSKIGSFIKKVEVFIKEKQSIFNSIEDIDIKDFSISLSGLKSNLPQGSYTIVVRASRNDGKIIEKEIPFDYKNYIINGWFKYPGMEENYSGAYTNDTDVYNYLNKKEGDYVPFWELGLQMHPNCYGNNPYFYINKIDKIIRFASYGSNGQGCSVWIKQKLKKPYKINQKTAIKICFEIIQLPGSIDFGDYLEGSLKINLHINGIVYTAAAFTDKISSYYTHDNFYQNLQLSNYHTFNVNIYNKTSLKCSPSITFIDQFITDIEIMVHSKDVWSVDLKYIILYDEE